MTALVTRVDRLLDEAAAAAVELATKLWPRTGVLDAATADADVGVWTYTVPGAVPDG